MKIMKTKPIPSTGLEAGKTYVTVNNIRHKIVEWSSTFVNFSDGKDMWTKAGRCYDANPATDLIAEVIDEPTPPDEIWVNIDGDLVLAFLDKDCAGIQASHNDKFIAVHYIRADSVTDASRFKELLKKARAKIWYYAQYWHVSERDFLSWPLIKEIDAVLEEK